MAHTRTSQANSYTSTLVTSKYWVTQQVSFNKYKVKAPLSLSCVDKLKVYSFQAEGKLAPSAFFSPNKNFQNYFL